MQIACRFAIKVQRGAIGVSRYEFKLFFKFSRVRVKRVLDHAYHVFVKKFRLDPLRHVPHLCISSTLRTK